MHKQTVYNHCQPFTAINNHCISCQPLCNNFSTNVQLCIHDRRHPFLFLQLYLLYNPVYYRPGLAAADGRPAARPPETEAGPQDDGGQAGQDIGTGQ